MRSSSMGSLYNGSKALRGVDVTMLRMWSEDSREDTATRIVGDKPGYVEEVSPPPVPQGESSTISRGIGRSVYADLYGGGAQAILEDWDIHGTRLVGRIYGDKNGGYPDGEKIYTDTVKTSIPELKEGAIIRTSGHYYLLGKRHVPNDE